jgi:hypothetical protein
MADQNPQHGRRPHFHRGRRGPDRRGNDRRHSPPQEQQQPARDQVDVEQIMREIRSRISQRHGIDLTTQQIQELAARRLEAILDPRTVKPSLLEQLRRSAGSPIETRPEDPSLSYTFEATTLYETPNGFVRFMRQLLHPILKLFFNPNPLIQALNTQTKINQVLLAREADRERRQTEWNALHYDILQRLVTEISRTSLDAQGLSMRVESLAGKVDFNERRVRGLENTQHQSRPAQRPAETPAAPSLSAPITRDGAPAEPASNDMPRESGAEGGRRRRRRRRGRRPQLGPPLDGGAPQGADQAGPFALGEGSDADAESDLDEDDDEMTVGDGVLVEASSSAEQPPLPARPAVEPTATAAIDSVTPAPSTSAAPHAPMVPEPPAGQPSDQRQEEPRSPQSAEPPDSGTST